MRIRVLDRAKKKKFLDELAIFGMKRIPETLVRSGKERIRAFSGSLSREEIMEIWRLFPIEGVGLYVGKDMMNRNGVREVRLSLDGMHVWKGQLSERIVELSAEQEVDWFLGKDVLLNEKQNIGEGFFLVKAGGDFVGMGKIGFRRRGSGAKERVLFSFLPKERRRKNRIV
jgi:NOL1/NOP2/fmu family ribosome biogenesis protein